jgi:hypothetical protein
MRYIKFMGYLDLWMIEDMVLFLFGFVALVIILVYHILSIFLLLIKLMIDFDYVFYYPIYLKIT